MIEVNGEMDASARPRLSALAAMIVGVVAVGCALAIGELIAAFVGANASPFLAVADGVVQLTKAGLKEFAVAYLGTNDKPVLLVTEGVVILLLAMFAGLISRRTRVPGMVIIIGFGLIGVIAVLARPDLGQLAVLAPVASVVVGLVVFAWLHTLAAQWAITSAATEGVEQGTDSDEAEGRRRFLLTSGGIALGAAVVGLGGQTLGTRASAESSRAAVGQLVPATPAPAAPAGADFAADGTPTFITDNSRFYRIDTALAVPQLSTQDWSLRIHGMVDRERTYRFADIRNRRLVEQPVTLTCVSNEVGGPYISTANFIGVPLRDLLLEAGVRPGADQVISTSVDNWSAGTPIDVLTDPDRGAMLAIGMNRQPLPAEHGFPARMVVPGLYGYVSATKWVVDLEVTTFAAKQGYWVPRGYSALAPIKTESRIDKPGSFDRVAAGTVTVAGIAWAQTKGISKVEVRMDGGPWQQAQLSAEVSKNTWRMWRTSFSLRAGSHTVESRATDDTGYTQTSAVAGDVPDGATGWPSIVFTVT